jgi:hypothetical protein
MTYQTRHPDSDSVNLGSNPSSPANDFRYLLRRTNRGLECGYHGATKRMGLPREWGYQENGATKRSEPKPPQIASALLYLTSRHHEIWYRECGTLQARGSAAIERRGPR